MDQPSPSPGQRTRPTLSSRSAILRHHPCVRSTARIRATPGTSTSLRPMSHIAALSGMFAQDRICARTRWSALDGGTMLADNRMKRTGRVAILRWPDDKAEDQGLIVWHVGAKDSWWFRSGASSSMIGYRGDNHPGSRIARERQVYVDTGPGRQHGRVPRSEGPGRQAPRCLRTPADLRHTPRRAVRGVPPPGHFWKALAKRPPGR